MSALDDILFVGQAPSKSLWEQCLVEASANIRLGIIDDWERTLRAEELAERAALSGASGQAIARLLDIPLAAFLRCSCRQNLNRRFLGRKSRGDSFDRVEGTITANKILLNDRFRKVVVLGREACECFALSYQPLSAFLHLNKLFFVLPHTSGLNLWWNSKRNQQQAAKALQKFIYETKIVNS